jgi:hypothetical protein
MTKRRSLKWHDYLICLLPVGAVLLVAFYLTVFTLHRKVELRDGGGKPGELESVLTTLRDFRNAAGYNSATGKTAAEAAVNEPKPTAEVLKMDSAISSTNSVAWGYASSLTLIVLLTASFIAGYVIWNGPRKLSSQRRWVIASLLMLVALGLVPLIDMKTHIMENNTKMIQQFLGVVQSHFVRTRTFDVETTQWFFLELGFGVTIALLFASAFTLLPLYETKEGSAKYGKQALEGLASAARYTAMQMKHLRAILYIGAILLVVISFQQNVILRWALDYLQPPPQLEKDPMFALNKFLFQRLEVLVSNLITGTGILNTLLLAGIYVPSALVLQRRAVVLSRLATGTEKRDHDEMSSDHVSTKEETEWMEKHGLRFLLREQLPKIAAILSPLLAGPIGQLLNFFK